ncbi:hypothetical protein NM688_g7985 [Phlebia brevispora]|uniref:Uncharacterized protein n=1 Tax=Phlebia brevispora TaxID=194682 RepID=A0ACC1RYW0_9APHY|nr:hypothetical protein NM688_g7985 [Phlebia brevispora]
MAYEVFGVRVCLKSKNADTADGSVFSPQFCVASLACETVILVINCLDMISVLEEYGVVCGGRLRVHSAGPCAYGGSAQDILGEACNRGDGRSEYLYLFTVIMASFLGFLKRIRALNNPPRVPLSTESAPIKFGILGAANIAPVALILPARSHAEVEVYAVAARDLAKAQAFAAKHGIEKAYGGPTAYQQLLDDPRVAAVYNPLPNGLHYEWTMKALSAGKHVLLEKPSSDTAAETREMFEYAEQKGLVLLEAFHYRFHPAVQRVKEILSSGELGAIKHVEARMAIPRGFIKDDDIRFNYELGGGAMMDMGCYTMDCLRYMTGSEPTSVTSAKPDLFPSKTQSPSLVDQGMTAELTFPNDVTGSLFCHLRHPPSYYIIPKMPEFLFEAECEGGELKFFIFALPNIYHYIEVSTKTSKDGQERKKRVEKVYKPTQEDWSGEDWWSTYRYQLEAFVNKVKGRKPQTWITGDDAVANMGGIEKVYEKSGLGLRPASEFKLPVL